MIEAKLTGIITTEEHEELCRLEPSSKDAHNMLRKLGSLGVPNEYAVLVHYDAMGQRLLDGFVGLSRAHQGDVVIETAENLRRLGLPAIGSSMTVMAEQHRRMLETQKLF